MNARAASFALIPIAVLIAGVAVWYFLPTKSTPGTQLPPQMDARTDAAPADVYQFGSTEPDVLAGILAASIPDAELKLSDQAQRDSFRTDAESWLKAYASSDAHLLVQRMQDASIALPLTWTDSSKATKGLQLSLKGLRQVRFDPSGTRVTGEPIESAAHPFHDHPKRMYTRDAARAFLQAPNVRANLLRREILVPGTVKDAAGVDMPVTLGIEFALDPASKRWVPIRTALYDLPNEVEGNGPIL